MLRKKSTVFKGNVQVYLQGQNALLPIQTSPDDQMMYYISTEESRILIRDHRRSSALAAREALAGRDIGFVEAFNQPAWAEIQSNQDDIQIDLNDGSGEYAHSTLWMGVLKDNQIPIYCVRWEKLTVVGVDSTIAFVALIED